MSCVVISWAVMYWAVDKMYERHEERPAKTPFIYSLLWDIQ